MSVYSCSPLIADAVERPIRLPGSPFWNVFKRFGTSELVALVVNVTATVIMSCLTASVLWLSLAGPIVEKIGFFPTHFYEAWNVYRTTPAQARKKLGWYFRRACRAGFWDLLEDIVIHDPVYVILFAWGLAYPGVPPWLLAFFSFVLAVFVVAALEVAISEMRFLLFQYRLKRAGFEREVYYESRFQVRLGTGEVERLIKKLKDEFGLQDIEEKTYNDRYFENNLAHYSGRRPVVRLRRRKLGPSDQKWLTDHGDVLDGSGFLQTLQVVYSRPNEARGRLLDQFRFFLILKIKFYKVLLQPMPSELEGVVGVSARALLKAKDKIKDVRFKRKVLKDRENDLLVAIDNSHRNNLCLVELKTFRDVNLLCRIMRFIMMESPAVQMTVQKLDWDF